jgi:hypothetical protein
MKNIVALSAFTAAVVTASANAELVSYWNFNSMVAAPNTATVINADQGAGTIYADGTNGSSIWTSTVTNPQITSFAGSTLNALGADVAGQALALANSSANGFSLVFAFSMTGFTDLTVSYATRGTSTGFNSQAWAWSTDGSTFTDFQTVTGTNVTTFFTTTLNALNALDNASTAFLRVTFTGASSATGNNRMDNVQFNAVPTPGAIALLGLAGLAGRRRR